jgi:hypothetical protein
MTHGVVEDHDSQIVVAVMVEDDEVADLALVGKASLVAHHYTYSVAHGWYATESSPQK